MINSIFSFFFAALMWTQVPQWNDDWSKCAVDVPDVDCHWYIVDPDNTFGVGYDKESAPLFSVEGLYDISKLKNTMEKLQDEVV